MPLSDIIRVRETVLAAVRKESNGNSIYTSILADEGETAALLKAWELGLRPSHIIRGTTDAGLVIFCIGISSCGGSDVVG